MANQVQVDAANELTSSSSSKPPNKLRVGILLLLFIFSCSPWLLLNERIIKTDTEAGLFSVIGLVATFFTWLFTHDEIVNFLGRIISKLKRIWRKQDILISYNISDYSWATWMDWQLRQEGYTVTLKYWNGNDYTQEVKEAGAKYLITILSPDYLDTFGISKSEWLDTLKSKNRMNNPKKKEFKVLRLFQSKSQMSEKTIRASKWIHFFKKMNGVGGRGLVVLINGIKEEDDLRSSINTVSLIRKNEDEARNMLINKIPPGFRKHPITPGQNSHNNQSSPRFPGNLPDIWNIPHPIRSPFFTGREDVLKALYDTFKIGGIGPDSRPQAICGLGGIGKTQVAVEFAHRYRTEFQYVLWISLASDTHTQESMKEIADLISRYEPEWAEQFKDPQTYDKAIVAWLEAHDKWLLLLDKCNDVAKMNKFLPNQRKGYILLTTRINLVDRVDTFNLVHIDKMRSEDAMLFLLRRKGGIIKPDGSLSDIPKSERKITIAFANNIANEMDGHPAALNYAGAYMNYGELGLSEYLDLYRKERPELIKRYIDLITDDSESVVFTWSLSYQEVQRTNPAAAELLRFCAFLSSEAIPETLITEGSSYLGPILQPLVSNRLDFIEAIRDLLSFSLIERDSGSSLKTLTIHRLVHDVIKDDMSRQEQEQLAKRIVEVVSHTFPDIEFKNWKLCRSYLPHALISIEYIRTWNIVSSESRRLLYLTGCYLREQGQYTEAEPLLIEALAFVQKSSDNDCPDLATCLDSLGELYHAQGKYTIAKPYYEKALALRLDTFGENHLDTAISLNNLGRLYDDYGESTRVQAGQFFDKALDIRKNNLDKDDPKIAISLNNVAGIHYKQGRKHELEGEEARMRKEIFLSQQNAAQARRESSLARYLDTLTKYEYDLALSLYKEALVICINQLGQEHPDTALTYANLASVYLALDNPVQAEQYYNLSLKISKNTLGDKHPQVSKRLNNLAELYRRLRLYDRADLHYQEALDIYEQKLGKNHVYSADILANYSLMLLEKNLYDEKDEFKKQENSRKARDMQQRASEILTRHAQENASFTH